MNHTIRFARAVIGIALVAVTMVAAPAFADSLQAAASPAPFSFDIAIAVLEKGLVFALPLLLIVVPIAVRALLGLLSAQDQQKLLAATKGAVRIVGAVAVSTDTKIDDALVQVLVLVEKELGKPLSNKQAAKVKSIALTLHTDPRFPILAKASGTQLLEAALAHVPTKRGR